MFIETDYNEVFENIDVQCKDLLKQLLSHDDANNLAFNDISYDLMDDFYANQPNSDSIYVIIEGSVAHEQENAILFHYDTGDLIGFDQTDDPESSRLYSTDPLSVRRYNKAELIEKITNTASLARIWSEYLIEDGKRRTCIIGLVTHGIDKASLGFVHYKEGDVIIEQGTKADCVYSIVEGSAEVIVNGIKVNDVAENEIFGALALLTNSPRTATVVASSTCMALVVPKAQFSTLMKTHPNICMNLMESMAQNIVSLNEKVITQESLS
ncbi:MAG: hypothetical protein COA99_08305 [Moraxellaceae bacterium]|nr:MAG: hypothetical protein COA99_08305 [Moraxellaceae bacterium]